MRIQLKTVARYTLRHSWASSLYLFFLVNDLESKDFRIPVPRYRMNSRTIRSAHALVRILVHMVGVDSASHLTRPHSMSRTMLVPTGYI